MAYAKVRGPYNKEVVLTVPSENKQDVKMSEEVYIPETDTESKYHDAFKPPDSPFRDAFTGLAAISPTQKYVWFASAGIYLGTPAYVSQLYAKHAFKGKPSPVLAVSWTSKLIKVIKYDAGKPSEFTDLGAFIAGTPDALVRTTMLMNNTGDATYQYIMLQDLLPNIIGLKAVKPSLRDRLLKEQDWYQVTNGKTVKVAVPKPAKSDQITLAKNDKGEQFNTVCDTLFNICHMQPRPYITHCLYIITLCNTVIKQT